MCIRDRFIPAERGQRAQADAEAANRALPAIAFPEQRHRIRDDLRGERRRLREAALALEGGQCAVAHGQADDAAAKPLRTEALGHALREHGHHAAHILFAQKVARRRGAVADGLDIWNMMRLLYRGDIPPLCEYTEDQPHFPKAPLQHIFRALRQPCLLYTSRCV